MSKLLGFREWVTLPDAAAYLTHELSEPVREADVVRLGLDSMLQLSVHFVNQAMARVGVLPEGEFLVDDFGQLSITWRRDKPEVIAGVWDLILAGSGEIELEKRLQHLNSGPEVTLWSVGGLYLAKPDRSEWAELITLRVASAARRRPELLLRKLPPMLKSWRLQNAWASRTICSRTTSRQTRPTESCLRCSSPCRDRPVERQSARAWNRWQSAPTI